MCNRFFSFSDEQKKNYSNSHAFSCYYFKFYAVCWSPALISLPLSSEIDPKKAEKLGNVYLETGRTLRMRKLPVSRLALDEVLSGDRQIRTITHRVVGGALFRDILAVVIERKPKSSVYYARSCGIVRQSERNRPYGPCAAVWPCFISSPCGSRD